MRFWIIILLAAAVSGAAPAKEKPAVPVPAPAVAGQKAPGFSLPAFPGSTVRLKDFQGRWLVLAFYPKANAPKDIIQMKSLKNAYGEIRALNAAVVGVSMDPPGVVQKFQADLALPFQLAVDSNKEASTAYGSLGIGGLFSTRRAVFVNPEGQLADALERCPEKDYGARVVERLKALQAPAPKAGKAN